jgi:hypothetical protein
MNPVLLWTKNGQINPFAKPIDVNSLWYDNMHGIDWKFLLVRDFMFRKQCMMYTTERYHNLIPSFLLWTIQKKV